MKDSFKEIQDSSLGKYNELMKELEKVFKDNEAYSHICIFACGSMGRLEMTLNSDLDLFFILDDVSSQSNCKVSNIDKYNFFSNLFQINQKFKYKDPSNNGEYWDFILLSNLLDIGSRQEDYNNSFTARMLLILESKPLYNVSLYQEIVRKTVDRYFIDYKDNKESFYPLFLMNDILRYWYTLTLNYEYRRDDHDDTNKKRWRALKLKYARLITCYSMIACLYNKKLSPEYVKQCINLTPFKRLELLTINNRDIKQVVSKIQNEYEWYLNLRKNGPEWWEREQSKQEAREHAEYFHDLVIHQLIKICADQNPELSKRTDIS